MWGKKKAINWENRHAPAKQFKQLVSGCYFKIIYYKMT